MGVDNQHADYASMLPKWKRCRDASYGQDAIHAAGSVYLPTLSDQTPQEYQAYLLRTPFYNATYRTISGLNGMLFRKPPTIDVSDIVKPMLDNIDLAGRSIHVFALEIAEEALTVGRVGIFVDYPIIDINSLTAADAINLNLRPMMKSYNAESIINWKTANIDNATILSMVVLQESHSIVIDQFTDKVQTQYRVLDLVTHPVSGKLVYRVRMFIINDKKEDILLSEVFPIINGENPNRIPFYFISTDDVTVEVDIPPLIDLVDLNLSHFRTSADYEHGCHFTGLPTPIISGYTPEREGEKFFIGSMSAWVFPRPDARATYLEFKGEGLNSLEKNLTRKEQQMAILGARMLEAQVKAVQSANTASIQRGGEQSTLASIAQAISIGIQQAMTTFADFAGVSGPVKFDLNRDFFPMPMDALTLTALVAGWQNGAYSYDTLFTNLKQGEVIALEQTLAQEIIDIAKQENKPIIPAGTKVNQSNNPTAHPTQRQLQTP